jgi:Rv2175c C-terminal domain of unknown function
LNEKKYGRIPGSARRYTGAVTISTADLDRLVPEWLTLPDLADRLDLPITRARQLLKDRQLLAVRRGTPPVLSVPAAFLDRDGVIKGLPGTITLLGDNKFTDEEALRWLFTPDESLPGTPVEALAQDRGTEVRRRAHALGF